MPTIGSPSGKGRSTGGALTCDLCRYYVVPTLGKNLKVDAESTRAVPKKRKGAAQVPQSKRSKS